MRIPRIDDKYTFDRWGIKITSTRWIFHKTGNVIESVKRRTYLRVSRFIVALAVTFGQWTLRTNTATVGSKLKLFEDHLIAIALQSNRAIGGLSKKKTCITRITLREISMNVYTNNQYYLYFCVLS